MDGTRQNGKETAIVAGKDEGKSFTNELLNKGKMLHFPCKLKVFPFVKSFFMNILRKDL